MFNDIEHMHNYVSQYQGMHHITLSVSLEFRVSFTFFVMFTSTLDSSSLHFYLLKGALFY